MLIVLNSLFSPLGHSPPQFTTAGRTLSSPVYNCWDITLYFFTTAGKASNSQFTTGGHQYASTGKTSCQRCCSRTAVNIGRTSVCVCWQDVLPTLSQQDCCELREEVSLLSQDCSEHREDVSMRLLARHVCWQDSLPTLSQDCSEHQEDVSMRLLARHLADVVAGLL